MHNNDSRLNFLLRSFLILALVLIFIVEVLLNLTPPIARDALIHHLAIPKLWLIHGGIHEIKWAVFSYYPMNVDLLYYLCLYFNNDILPNFIHMGFGIGTACLIYLYLNRHFGRVQGLLGVLVFISTPVIMRSSTEAYVDLGLVFFTTASILAFLHWRNQGYRGYKWLFVASVAMGLALGTKYNALVAWFFLTFAVVFVHSRDTGEQWRSIRSGIVFFLVSLLLFSPWLIKNWILTGNPLYPLLKGFFQAGFSGVTPDGSGTRSLVSGVVSMGMFESREIMYGDSIWETLLIPIRFFFQGQDNSGRYFDGVLNPLLLVMTPFAFMNRSRHADKLFYALFSAFFILTAFFLDQHRIRYILPTVPFLSILATIGMGNLFIRAASSKVPLRHLYMFSLLSFLVVLGAGNAVYLHEYYQRIQPLSVVLGRETREDYLTRHLKSYPAIRYINDHTPQDARIRLLFLAGRGYYLDRIYEDDATFGMNVIRGLVAKSNEAVVFRKYLDSIGCTHLLVRVDLFERFLRDNFTQETINGVYRQIDRTTEKIYDGDGYAVYRIVTETPMAAEQ